MTQRFDPEEVDLEQLAKRSRLKLGASVEGEVVGRTRLRDVVVADLCCSQLEAEELVDTMISLGFVRIRRNVDGSMEWLIGGDPGLDS